MPPKEYLAARPATGAQRSARPIDRISLSVGKTVAASINTTMYRTALLCYATLSSPTHNPNTARKLAPPVPTSHQGSTPYTVTMNAPSTGMNPNGTVHHDDHTMNPPSPNKKHNPPTHKTSHYPLIPVQGTNPLCIENEQVHPRTQPQREHQ